MGRFTQLMPNPAHELVSVIYELNGRQMLEQEVHAIATKKLLVEWQFCHLPKRIPCEKKLMNKKNVYLCKLNLYCSKVRFWN